jgi:bla regulator protein blaR1
MLTWILYVLVITLLLSGAALAAEHGARLRRARSRWIWAVTIVASLVVPAFIASVSIQIPSLLTPTVSRKVTALRELTSVQVVPMTWVRAHTSNRMAAGSENRLLQRTWFAVSAALLAALALNGALVHRRKRAWRVGTVAGVPVYIAPDAGPAVVGLLRPRIVVPEWLAGASPSRQAMVMAHERAHLEAHDPQLLTVALCLVVLMPWNLPLWWQLHRLRYAIEVDCDARALQSGLDTIEYGETLIDVSQRPVAYIGSVAAMSESGSFLEKRIAIMVSDPRKWAPALAAMLGCLAVALVAVATQVTPPNLGSADLAPRRVSLPTAVLEEYAGYYVRGENVVYAITRKGDHLFLQLPWLPPIELFANPELSFVTDAGTPPISFVHDEAGRTTGLVMHWNVFGTEFSVPMQRIDAVTADAIAANNGLRARSQTPMPGSDAALRRLIEGIIAGKPHYDEMTAWYAELVRQAGSITRAIYAKRGVVRSIEFRHVDETGGDVYEVRQEAGFSTWVIFLNSNGLIADALDIVGD